MRIVFLGTAEFSVIVLDKLLKSNNEIVGVISQPNREKDKKGNLVDTPIKRYSQANNLKLFQFDKVGQHIEELKSLRADIFITASYGQLLSQQVIDIPPYGIINTHASLLPKYRGSSPIQAAIKNGDSETGVSIMRTELSMDTGDILGVAKIEITDFTTAGELETKLANIAGDKLIEVLENFDYIVPIKQNSELATYTKKIKKEDALLCWEKTAFSLLREVNAYNPAPISYFMHNDKNIKVFAVDVVKSHNQEAPGKILFADAKNGLIISCGEHALKINKLQAPGKNVLNCVDFLKGYKFEVGEVLT